MEEEGSLGHNKEEAVKIIKQLDELAQNGYLNEQEIELACNVKLKRKNLIFDEAHPLGSGQFGTVYKGLCNGTQCAVKCSKSSANPTNAEKKRTISELNVWSQSQNEHIVMLYGAIIKPQQHYIVTELMDGDLSSLIHSRTTQLSIFERLDLARQASLGMEWLHNRNKSISIVHRDLKPANMLYRHTSVGFSKYLYIVKIGDFGLASFKSNSNSPSSSNPKPSFNGSPSYSAPEILSQAFKPRRPEDRFEPVTEIYTEKSDVYSFGISLWEIVTRKKLYEKQKFQSIQELYEHVVEFKERLDINEVEDVKGLRDLIEQCWDEDPSVRPDFNGITKRLEELMIRSVIKDEDGFEFWSKQFRSNSIPGSSVEWPVFKQAFYTQASLPIPPLASPGRKVSSRYKLLAEYNEWNFVEDENQLSESRDPSTTSNSTTTTTTTTSTNSSNTNNNNSYHISLSHSDVPVSTYHSHHHNNKLSQPSTSPRSNSSTSPRANSSTSPRPTSSTEDNTSSNNATGDNSLSQSLPATKPSSSKSAVPEFIQNHRCMKKTLVTLDSRGREVVTITAFGAMLDWFGPLYSDKKELHVFNAMRRVYRCKFFFGSISSRDAEVCLTPHGPKSFLVRLSSSLPGGFVLSWCVEGHKVREGLIKYESGKFSIVPSSKKSSGKPNYYKTLLRLVKDYSDKLGLEFCPMSPLYQEVFVEPVKTEEEDSEEL